MTYCGYRSGKLESRPRVMGGKSLILQRCPRIARALQIRHVFLKWATETTLLRGKSGTKTTQSHFHWLLLPVPSIRLIRDIFRIDKAGQHMLL